MKILLVVVSFLNSWAIFDELLFLVNPVSFIRVFGFVVMREQLLFCFLFPWSGWFQIGGFTLNSLVCTGWNRTRGGFCILVEFLNEIAPE